MLNVLLIVSKIGVDMSKWRSPKAFSSWLGLCPGNKISGGKVLDSRQVVNRVADALRLAAQSVDRTETCFGIFYRRKQAHLGAPKANTATARKLACLILAKPNLDSPVFLAAVLRFIGSDRQILSESIHKRRFYASHLQLFGDRLRTILGKCNILSRTAGAV